MSVQSLGTISGPPQYELFAVRSVSAAPEPHIFAIYFSAIYGKWEQYAACNKNL